MVDALIRYKGRPRSDTSPVGFHNGALLNLHKHCGWYYDVNMPRVGEFCASNIARLLLSVGIVVVIVAALGVWLYHSPAHGPSIEHAPSSASPVR